MNNLQPQVFKLRQTNSGWAEILILMGSFFLLAAILPKYEIFRAMFAIIMISIYIYFSFFSDAEAIATSDSTHFTLKVTKSGFLLPKQEHHFKWESLRDYKIIRSKSRSHLRLRWNDSKDTCHRFTGQDSAEFNHYLQNTFPDKKSKSWF